MSLWTMPAVVSAALDQLAAFLDRRTRDRFWSVFFGLLLCREKRRTAVGLVPGRRDRHRLPPGLRRCSGRSAGGSVRLARSC